MKYQIGCELVEARARLLHTLRRFVIVSVQRLGWFATVGDAPALQPTM